MKPSLRILSPLLLALAMLPSPPARADNDAAARGWELRAEGERHALYARAREGSEYHEYRMTVRFDATPDEVMAALEHNVLDPEAFPASMRRTLVRRDGDAIVSHDYISVPFLADRDAVMRTEVERDARPGVHVMRWYTVEGEGPAPGEDVVRMPSSTGSWTLAPDGEDATRAVYESHTELGGSLPGGFVRSQTEREILQQAEAVRRTLRERELAQR